MIAAPSVESGGRAPSRPPRFAFNPGLPDLAAFPRAAWATATRRNLRGMPASTLAYNDSRGHAELGAALAEYVARARGAIADPELIVVCPASCTGCRCSRACCRPAAWSELGWRTPATGGIARSRRRPACSWCRFHGRAAAPGPFLADSGAGAAFPPGPQFPSGRSSPEPGFFGRMGTNKQRDRHRGRLRRRAALRPPAHRRVAGSSTRSTWSVPAPPARRWRRVSGWAGCSAQGAPRSPPRATSQRGRPRPVPHQLAFAELPLGRVRAPPFAACALATARAGTVLAILAERETRATMSGSRRGPHTTWAARTITFGQRARRERSRAVDRLFPVAPAAIDQWSPPRTVSYRLRRTSGA